MTDRFGACVAFVLSWEAGYVDLAADRGGCTNRGITIGTLAAWRGKRCTPADVLALGEVEARAIYRSRYWAPIKGDQLPAPVDLAMLDAAVNSGPAQAARWLQVALGLLPDGFIGPKTLAALAAENPQQVAHTVCALRLKAMQRMTGWPTFGRGWTARLTALRAALDAAG